MGNDDTQDQAPEDDGSGIGLSKQKPSQNCFDDLPLGLGIEDLGNPALHKMTLSENRHLKTVNTSLKVIENQFHESDKRVAVLEEKNKTTLSIEVISLSSTSIGAALIGHSPILWKSQPSGVLALIFGLILLLAGIVAKAVKR